MGPNGVLVYDTQCPASPALPPDSPNAALAWVPFLHLNTLLALSGMDAQLFSQGPRGAVDLRVIHWPIPATSQPCPFPCAIGAYRRLQDFCISHNAVSPKAEINIQKLATMSGAVSTLNESTEAGTQTPFS